MPPIKIVIDLDGTLIKTDERHVEAMRRATATHYIEIPTYGFLEFKREGLDGKAWLTNACINPEMALRIHRAWIELIESPDLLRLDRLFSDSITFLTSLDTTEVALCTARVHSERAVQQISDLGIRDFFSHVEVVSPFNSPSAAKSDFLRRFGANVIIGDSEVDLHASEQAGIQSLLLSRGSRSEGFWRRAGITAFPDLLALLGVVSQLP